MRLELVNVPKNSFIGEKQEIEKKYLQYINPILQSVNRLKYVKKKVQFSLVFEDDDSFLYNAESAIKEENVNKEFHPVFLHRHKPSYIDDLLENEDIDCVLTDMNLAYWSQIQDLNPVARSVIHSLIDWDIFRNIARKIYGSCDKVIGSQILDGARYSEGFDIIQKCEVYDIPYVAVTNLGNMNHNMLLPTLLVQKGHVSIKEIVNVVRKSMVSVEKKEDFCIPFGKHFISANNKTKEVWQKAYRLAKER